MSISFEGNSLSSAIYVKRPNVFRMSNSLNGNLTSNSMVIFRPSFRYSADIKSMGGVNIDDNSSLEFPTVYGYIQ